MRPGDSLLASTLRDPATIGALSLSDWDMLVRQGRRAMLLSRLALALQEADLMERVPHQPRAHLLSDLVVTEKLAKATRREVEEIRRALDTVGCKTLLLKGAAYQLSGLKAGEGRLFSDIDILVPKASLDAVETALRRHGWASMHQDEYDQKYYRQWMHELPPLTHAVRKSSLDVHHNILPETARACPDADKLLAYAVKVSGEDVWVLAPEDMVLHSATHLFYDGELDHGLRDLADLDLLLRQFGSQDGFWNRLQARAVELELGRPLFYALRYVTRILGTPIPESLIRASRENAPGKLLMALLDALFLRALAPDHSSCDDRWTGMARWMLFVRSHWLRMPPLLLTQHLIRKGFRRWQSQDYLQKA